MVLRNELSSPNITAGRIACVYGLGPDRQFAFAALADIERRRGGIGADFLKRARAVPLRLGAPDPPPVGRIFSTCTEWKVSCPCSTYRLTALTTP